MAQIRVAILDPTGGRKTLVELPDDVPMERLVPALVERMELITQQGNRPISYRLDHPESGLRLADEDTLADAGIGNGSILSLFPEVTAGRQL
jgi:hypothetical protein